MIRESDPWNDETGFYVSGGKWGQVSGNLDSLGSLGCFDPNTLIPCDICKKPRYKCTCGGEDE